MIDWFLFILPWWVKVGGGVIIALIILRLLGWKASVAAIVAVVTLGAVNRGQQQGWEARLKKDNADADKAIERARAARAAADRHNANAGELRKPDKYRRD